MSLQSLRRHILIAACLLAGIPACHAVDSVALEAGNANRTRLIRVSAQWNWQSQWWKSNGTHIGGYWDLNLAQWHGTRFQNIPGNTQDIYVIGATPVFRFQKDSLTGLYGEAGIGVNYLSDLYDNNNRKLSTRLEFGSHLGVGYQFENNLDLSLRFQHFSNGGIKEPNNGVNFTVLRAAYRF